MDAAGWRAVGRELGDFTERFAKAGINLGYHNHHWELDKKDGDKTALELLFEAAGSSGLAWEVDVAWLVRGNADPTDWIERYQPIITAAHVKDIAAGLSRFSNSGLRQYEALAVQGQRVLDDIDRVVRSFSANPGQLIWVSRPGLPEYRGQQ